MNYNIYIAIAIAIVSIVMISVSLVFAYRTVLSPKDSVACPKRKNGDVCLDEICESFLILTNLGDVDIP